MSSFLPAYRLTNAILGIPFKLFKPFPFTSNTSNLVKFFKGLRSF
ncbi:NADH dehydrogenase subunit 1, partial [Listeria ivanovii FSL F6-596]